MPMTAPTATLAPARPRFSTRGALAAAPARIPNTALRTLGLMTRDPKVYGLGLHHLEMQNLREFDQHPRLENIPKTHRNQCLGQTLSRCPTAACAAPDLTAFGCFCERGDCSALAL